MSGEVRLLKYDAARQALAAAHRVDEAKDIRDKALAVQAYARQAKDGALIAMATEIKIRAERRVGDLWREMEKSKGSARPGVGRRGRNAVPDDDRITLAKLKLTKQQASDFVGLSKIPEATFERHLAGVDLAKVTTRKVLGALLVDQRRAKNERAAPTGARTGKVDDLDDLVRRGVRVGTIYADPPWLYDNQGTRAATGNHYKGLTVEELCALPISKLAAEDSHLHLWTTNAFLFECPRLFRAWGFEFRSSFVWVKPQLGLGNYWRNSHEILLTAIRGRAKSFAGTFRSWLEYERGRHSAKPDPVRDMVAKASPSPRLELYGRDCHDGWMTYGGEA